MVLDLVWVGLTEVVIRVNVFNGFVTPLTMCCCAVVDFFLSTILVEFLLFHLYYSFNEFFKFNRSISNDKVFVSCTENLSLKKKAFVGIGKFYIDYWIRFEKT